MPNSPPTTPTAPPAGLEGAEYRKFKVRSKPPHFSPHTDARGHCAHPPPAPASRAALRCRDTSLCPPHMATARACTGRAGGAEEERDDASVSWLGRRARETCLEGMTTKGCWHVLPNEIERVESSHGMQDTIVPPRAVHRGRNAQRFSVTRQCVAAFPLGIAEKSNVERGACVSPRAREAEGAGAPPSSCDRRRLRAKREVE